MFSHQQQQFLHDEQQQQQHMMFMAKRLEALVQQAEEQFRRGRGGAAFMLCLEAAALEAHLDPLAALLHATLPQQAWPHLNNNANHNNANHSNHLASSASSPHYLVSAPGTAAADERLSAMAPLLGAEAVNFELSQLAIADLITASQSLTLPGDPDLDAATEFDWKLEVACDTTPAATATSATTAPSSSSSASSSSNGLSYPSNCTSASLSASASALLHSAHSSHSSHSSLFESGLIPPPPPASASAIRTIDARDYAYVARGMLLLGLLLRGGFGVELNKPRAFEWFRHSASRGNYLAMHQMACCLQNGWGVEKDRARAQALIRMCISDVISLAGRTDDWLAVYMYGYSLHDGFGCVANVVVAREAYRRSAMQGLGFSSYNLGTCAACLYHWHCHFRCHMAPIAIASLALASRESAPSLGATAAPEHHHAHAATPARADMYLWLRAVCRRTCRALVRSAQASCMTSVKGATSTRLSHASSTLKLLSAATCLQA